MTVTIIAKQRFIHCSHDLAVGDEIVVHETLANELALCGLVEIKADKAPAAQSDGKAAPAPENKMAREPKNKAGNKQ
ncbi:hypothetical protein V8G57_15635 [Collimonas sp. H4R21]|uniref:Mu-like prophage FluMu N-terminal domain-containing protein n=1 Tax=Collimonas rhizosphaerae TaxID=3126357 RepID=A0ABU9PXU3_9BURK